MDSFTIRPFTRADRAVVRHICCETGYAGNPVDVVFSDRDVFADFFTRYYTDFEPESCLVAEADGGIVGYLIGCFRHDRYPWLQGLLLLSAILPKMIGRILQGRGRPQDRRFLRWVLLRSVSETPAAPSAAAHFHINILPPWRNGAISRRLIFSFLDLMKRRGARGVFGQIQIYEDRRPVKIFERYGFRVFDQRRVTKFEPYFGKAVYVTTFFKEFF